MSKEPTLSIAPYYGGKSRMAHFIAERLNYADTDTFVTPFGGMCRVLLNKPRHPVECYNDYNAGLVALMNVLSDTDKSREFIYRLYNETEYSLAEFEKQKAIYDNVETDLDIQERNKLRRLLLNNGIGSPTTVNSLLDEILNNAIHEETGNHKFVSELQSLLASDDSFRTQFTHLLGNWIALYEKREQQGMLERTPDLGEDVSEMDLAIATYVVFQQSRDGMGQTWSESKFKTSEQYLNRVLTLYECAERLAGVHVFQIDAVDFFRKYYAGQHGLSLDMESLEDKMMNEWINNPCVMMYCDPSYISVESEAKMLEGIDVENTDSLSDAIKQKYGDKMPKNLGKIYSRSFGYDEQEKFLRYIQNAKCRILVSNYDLVLYNKYLNPDHGWRREEFVTTTGVGSKANNTRIEVIWYNY